MLFRLYLKRTWLLMPVIALALQAMPVSAQSYSSVGYNMSFPVSLADNYITKNSYAGINVEFGYYLTENFSLGIRAGWHSFYETRKAQEYTNDNVTLYGKQFRYIDSYPIMLSARYTFGDTETEIPRLRPFVGVGLGGYSFNRQTDMGVYSFSDNESWHFGLQPEAGILINLSEKAALNLAARYNQMFKNSDTGGNGYLGIQVGIQFYPRNNYVEY